MISKLPRPDEWDEPDTPDATIGAGWTEEGSAGRSGIDADEVDRASRTYWEAEADAYQAEHGEFLRGRPAADAAVDPPSVMDSVDEVNGIHDASKGVADSGEGGGAGGVAGGR